MGERVFSQKFSVDCLKKGGEVNLYFYLTQDQGSGRRRRDTYSGVTYKDIFPEYPSGLRMREDVANFVSLCS